MAIGLMTTTTTTKIKFALFFLRFPLLFFDWSHARMTNQRIAMSKRKLDRTTTQIFLNNAE